MRVSVLRCLFIGTVLTYYRCLFCCAVESICHIALRDLSKTRNPKSPEHRYFSVSALTELDEAGAAYEEFVTFYATFVIQRSKLFTARCVWVC